MVNMNQTGWYTHVCAFNQSSISYLDGTFFPSHILPVTSTCNHCASMRRSKTHHRRQVHQEHNSPWSMLGLCHTAAFPRPATSILLATPDSIKEFEYQFVFQIWWMRLYFTSISSLVHKMARMVVGNQVDSWLQKWKTRGAVKIFPNVPEVAMCRIWTT